MNARAECLVLSADPRRESDAVSFIVASCWLVAHRGPRSGAGAVGSWTTRTQSHGPRARRATLTPPAGPTRGSRRTPAPKSVGALGDLVDVRDLDVGQPRRRLVPHSTMPPAQDRES